MAVPKKRTSSSKRDMRRAHDFLTPKMAMNCPQCDAFVLRHRACSSCGWYRGRTVTKAIKTPDFVEDTDA